MKRIARCSCGKLSAEISGDTVGAFAEPGFPAPAFSVYEERMHPWVVMPDSVEHMQ